MNTEARQFGRVLVFVAHPDDETIACSGLLQRTTAALVVFAVDGAPPHYGFEKKFGSLRNFSAQRFQEASRALSAIPHCSFRRLTKCGRVWFVDQHLFLEMPEAFVSLCRIIREFSPDLLVSHAFEGGHLDHDACHVLAQQVASKFKLSALEFPLYWRAKRGGDVLQRFRQTQEGEFVLQLSASELRIKRQMLGEYHSQQALTAVFEYEVERFRPPLKQNHLKAEWSEYPFENSRKPWKADLFFRKVEEFETQCAVDAEDGIPCLEAPARS
jgi:N-acetylglucosamine malate deacetylase 2